MNNSTTISRVYLDHAAATPLLPEVKAEMQATLEFFGNPSSLHQEGKQAKAILDNARKTVADFLSAQASEIIFTSSGTESCNLAILGSAFTSQQKGKHIITTSVEHHAVLEACKFLEQQGFEVTYLPVDEDGLVTPSQFAEVVREDTILVSVIFANNEVGSINAIKEITRAVKKKNASTLVHTDACQAGPFIPLNVQSLGVDLLTLNSAKLYGPKGSAVLYKKKAVELTSFIRGGGQEQDLRAGTENIVAIAGFAKAIELVKPNEGLTQLRDEAIQALQKAIPGIELNGHMKNRLANNINISIPGMDGETLVIYLDQRGIACSTGAACTTAKTEPSHVLLAMGKTPEQARSSLRFTLGHSTTKADIDYLVKQLTETVQILKTQ